ncbi:MAG: TRAP transporter TatT component family protein [Candidatus Bipolaricaulota bacterium]|nr:TRAP transporter TatT component family protein [Candidatus Bipolaricaulota bacterium]
MTKKILGLALVTLCAIGASGLAMTLDGALALFQNDNIAVTYTDEGREQLLEVIGTLRSALGVTDALNEENEDVVNEFVVDASLKDVVTKLSQAYYTLANVFYTPETNEATYLKGKHWGLKSLRMNPGFVELEKKSFVDAAKAETDVAALYWATANWLRVSQKNALEAVFAGVPAKTQAMSERTLELAPGYVAGGSYRSLGAYWSGLPIGKDMDKALGFLCHVVTESVCSACGECQPAFAGADEYFENRTFIAEFYYMPKSMWADAARVLESVIAEPIGTKYPLMNAYAQDNARNLLVEVQTHL